MANDTFTGIAGKVLLRAQDLGIFLAQDFVRNSFRDIVERRRWSWLLKRSQIMTFDQYAVGTATVVAGTSTVTLTTGVVDFAFIGRQFRIGTSFPIATITDVDVAANTLTIDQLWWPTTSTAQTYSIYQAYVSLPSDFHSLLSVSDPRNGWTINDLSSIEAIDNFDPQRASSGSYGQALGYFDYYLGSPRYELWPHQRSAAVFPISYESRPIDPFDVGATVPTLLPSNIILERALMYLALWPGTESIKNPYYSQNSANKHQEEYERQLIILVRQDNEHMQQDMWYQSEQRGYGGIMSASWMQSHDW